MLTNEETYEPIESNSESEESINHLGETKTIEDGQKQYAAVIQVKRMNKEFIIDSGSLVTLMPPDERILRNTKNQKIRIRYQNVNKNDVKF